MNTKKAPRKVFGGALGGVGHGALVSIFVNAFRERLGPWAAAGVVLMAGSGVVAAFSALSAEPERRPSAKAPAPELVLAEPSGIPFCHSSIGAAARAGAAIRLAASRTEVPSAEIQASAPSAAFANIDPPLWDGLGALSYKVTTANPAAQSYFDQGLRLTYAFNHAEAQRAFRKAEKLDPHCAMCLWGEALVLGPNINMPMSEEAVAPAFAAVQKAQALASSATPHEQMLIAALAKRYADRRPDLADLCLIRMSELFPNHSIITVDQDFRIYRRNKREVIPLICPPRIPTHHGTSPHDRRLRG